MSGDAARRRQAGRRSHPTSSRVSSVSAVVCLGLWALCFGACATTGPSEQTVEEARTRLLRAMRAPVESRERRDAQSRLLADNVDTASLTTLDRNSVRSLFGPGLSCELTLCTSHGFHADDWYYELGVNQSAQVKQLPLLMIAFDPHQRVTRVFTLTTH